MKLKKVASLCSKTKIFCLYDREEYGGEVSQWLGAVSYTHLDVYKRQAVDFLAEP